MDCERGSSNGRGSRGSWLRWKCCQPRAKIDFSQDRRLPQEKKGDGSAEHFRVFSRSKLIKAARPLNSPEDSRLLPQLMQVFPASWRPPRKTLAAIGASRSSSRLNSALELVAVRFFVQQIERIAQLSDRRDSDRRLDRADPGFDRALHKAVERRRPASPRGRIRARTAAACRRFAANALFHDREDRLRPVGKIQPPAA